MILIFPPVTKLCEPPAGVALLAGALKMHGLDCHVIDANLEGLLWLARAGNHPDDSWTRRALTHYEQNLEDLKHPEVYGNMGRYRQRIMDINRVISSGVQERFRITLADYSDDQLKPVKSRDLLKSAKDYSENPFCGFFDEVLKSSITVSKSDYIGISLCFLSQALTAFALTGWVRENFPEKKIVMGGGLITSWMSSPDWKNPFAQVIDILIPGDGEAAVVALEGAEADPDEPVAPDFDFCRWHDYLAPGRILPFRASSGCYWGKCRFCPEAAEGNHYRPGRSEDLIKDLMRLSREYAPEYVHFLDNAVPPAFMRAMTRVKLPFAWYGFVRFTRDLADPAFAKSLYRSGCRMLNLGLESGDQQVLNRMQKGTDLDLASKALTALKNAGIATYVYILFGTSFETEQEAEKTLAFVAEHSDRISFLNVAIFNLPRLSSEAVSLETDRFYEGDLSLYLNFKHPSGWGRDKVRRFLDRRFKRHPDIAPIIRDDPPFFSSNHAMFLT